MKKISLVVLTTSRADYGPLRPLLTLLKRDAAFDLRLLIGGAHLSARHGLTVDGIRADGLSPSALIPGLGLGETGESAARSLGPGIDRIARALRRLKPHLLVLLGDRYELLAAAAAAICLRIPIFHIGGGHLTLGAMDEQVRHALTKMAHLHSVANRTNERRLIQMGEQRWRICVSGSLGIDTIMKTRLPADGPILSDLGLDPAAPTGLVTLHPDTLNPGQASAQVSALLAGIRSLELQFLFTFPNADPGGAIIRRQVESFVRRRSGRAAIASRLGQERYLSVLRAAAVIIGNSSSALIEAPCFNVPVVNIGVRQEGRAITANVFQARSSSGSIRNAVERALRYKGARVANPYGDGRAAERISSFLKRTMRSHSGEEILKKCFMDLKVAQ